VPGLVWAYEFDEHGRGRPIAELEIPGLSNLRRGFLWLHFNLVDLRVCDWCAAEIALPAKAKGAFLSADTHLRLDHSEGRVWGVFADLAHESDAAADAHAQLRFVMATAGW
jgi:hypothetical protein